MREKGLDPIVLDAGDMLFSTKNINKNNMDAEKHRSKSMLEGYKRIGCDGLNIGHYELLMGSNYIKGLSEDFKEITFLSANLYDKNTDDYLFEPYKIIQKNNLKIAIIGVTDMVPDTMKSIKTEDYILAGNYQINSIKNKVDLVILLVNSDRKTHSSLASKFKDANYIFVSGSTNRTSPSQPQKEFGPFVYSNGKQGKFLSVIDIEMNDPNSSIVDISRHQSKSKQMQNRLNRLQKKDPERRLEDIYADQDNILNLIKRYRNDLLISEKAILEASNTTKFKSLALDREIIDDPEFLFMVNEAIKTCKTLDLSLNKGTNKKSHSHRHSKQKKRNQKNNIN